MDSKHLNCVYAIHIYMLLITLWLQLFTLVYSFIEGLAPFYLLTRAEFKSIHHDFYFEEKLKSVQIKHDDIQIWAQTPQKATAAKPKSIFKRQMQKKSMF